MSPRRPARPDRCRHGIAAALALLSATVCATPAAAPPATLDAALHWLTFAVADAPSVRSAEFAERAATGALRSARGTFDPVFAATTTLDVARGELLPIAIRREVQSRFLFEQLDTSFTATANQLQADLDANGGSADFICGDAIIVINGQQVCDTPQAARERQAFIELVTALAGQAPSEQSLIQLQAIRDQTLANNREILEQTIEQLRRVAQSAALSRARLGDVPETERKTTLTADLSYRFAWRNGWTLTPQLILEGVDDNYEHKPRSSTYGGKGLDRVFRSAMGVGLAVPLGRGGRETVTADEDVAALRRDAATLDADDTRRSTLYQVLAAHVGLLAAEARATVASGRAARSAQTLELADALVRADQLAPSERASGVALAASARGDQALTTQQVLQARRSLAELLGVSLEQLDRLPRSGTDLETLATLPRCAGTLEDWRRAAREERPDLAAARLRQRAAERLVDAARDQSLPRLDFGLTLAWGGREERNEVVAGYGNALFDRPTGPSVLATLAWDMAWRNDSARGQLQQALALAEQYRVAALEAERRIDRALTRLDRVLDDGARRLALRRTALQRYREAHEGLVALVRAGEAPLLDLVSSEQTLDAAESALIGAEQAQALAQLELRHTLSALTPAAGSGAAALASAECRQYSIRTTATDAALRGAG